MKKYQAAMAAAVALSAAMTSAPASAQFGGLVGAAMSARANAGKANAATAAAAATVSAPNPFASDSLPAAAMLLSPAPLAGTEGKFMSPFKADGSIAEWAAKGMKMQGANTAGSALGAYAGEKLAEKGAAKMASMVPVPGLGGLAAMAARKTTAAAATGLAIQSVGGADFVKSSSDLSFNTLEELAVFLYVNHSSNPDYAKVAAATTIAYPQFSQVYLTAVQSASLK